MGGPLMYRLDYDVKGERGLDMMRDLGCDRGPNIMGVSDVKGSSDVKLISSRQLCASPVPLNTALIPRIGSSMSAGKMALLQLSLVPPGDLHLTAVSCNGWKTAGGTS